METPLLKEMKSGLLLCIQFFTIIPYKKEIPWEKKTIQWCLLTFPLIGLIIGVIGWIQLWSLTTITPLSSLFVSFWILFYFVAISGGLHLDGWMDCSDAYFSYRDQDKRLEIMEDPRVGSFAVFSVLFLLGFRFLFIYELIQLNRALTFSAVLLIPVLSRGMVVFMLIKGKLAKDTGLAAAFQKGVSSHLFKVSALITLVIAASIGFFLHQIGVTILLLVASILFLIGFYSFCKKQFGGMNGDTLGALLEGGETFLWFVLWLLLYFVTA
ncbi:adenosylcobinamide-GDP ribazoletransferase [Bacillus sp. DJP31]|uniref:adenosylcobinamide-GDP ribazoletransferase n=1 Tax=Bacillus sp. DJP31 TaxID=3409789 RepID=UPI003BB571F6